MSEHPYVIPSSGPPVWSLTYWSFHGLLAEPVVAWVVHDSLRYNADFEVDGFAHLMPICISDRVGGASASSPPGTTLSEQDRHQALVTELTVESVMNHASTLIRHELEVALLAAHKLGIRWQTPGSEDAPLGAEAPPEPRRGLLPLNWPIMSEICNFHGSWTTSDAHDENVEWQLDELDELVQSLNLAGLGQVEALLSEDLAAKLGVVCVGAPWQEPRSEAAQAV